MDSREGEVSHWNQHPGPRRPWEGTPPPFADEHVWPGPILPPLDTALYTRPSAGGGTEGSNGSSTRGVTEASEPAVKKARYGENALLPSAREPGDSMGPDSHARSRPRGPDLGYPHPFSRDPPIISFEPEEQNPPSVLLTAHESAAPAASLQYCEMCSKDAKVAQVTYAAADALTQLAETLRSGIKSGERRHSSDHERRPSRDATFPPAATCGLNRTLEWILERVYEANDLADQLVQSTSPTALRDFRRKASQDDGGQTLKAQDGFQDMMKRRIDSEADHTFRKRSDFSDAASDGRYNRRISGTTSMSVGEDYPSMRSNSPYQTPVSSEGLGQRLVNINLPSAAVRAPSSPSGPPIPSPQSLNPSSYGGYGPSAISSNFPPSGGFPHPESVPHLPPLSGHHPDSALQAHSTALQHEVSVQKLALSTLQGEHDKLLSAFSRSQTRASALERKHAVSDNEIINLSEEKMRLQAQVLELEQQVEGLARSRDDYRQAAVQEGAQYVEIVKKATRLQEMAGEERRNWNNARAELERHIEALSGDQRGGMALQELDSAAFAATAVPTASLTEDSSTRELRDEVLRLRDRCAQFERALRNLRDDTRSIEGIVEALGLAGRGIAERAEAVLGTATSPPA